MNVYKISSSDLTNTPLIKHIAKKNKPIILSIGASNKDEVDNAVRLIRNYNSRELVLLHCILEYPTPYAHANLNRLLTLKSEYPDVIVGYSDHTKPDSNFDIIKTAYSLGAVVVEKHFTSDKKLIGNDHYHSIDSEDARKIIEEIEFLDLIKGSKEIKSLDSENSSRINARRSIVAYVEIKAGDIINERMLVFKRPGTGISPDRMQDIVGKIAKYDIPEDTIIKYDMLH
jgi:N-acetylneuraminate synthase